MTDKGNVTVSKLPESNMAFGVLGMFLGLLLEVSTHSPSSVPRISWKHEEVNLIEFSEPGVFNYSTLLMSEEKEVLYVGAREAIFELNIRNVSIRNNKVQWTVPQTPMMMCMAKGKSKETDCLNYIRVLQVLDEDRLYVCGTHAFQPLCDNLSLKDFSLEGRAEDGRGKCSFDPSQSFTTIMVDGELYSGTAYNFLGSEPIISRYPLSQSLLRTEYSTSWLNEPSFVFADVIREGKNSADGEEDKIYFFFTEVSVEYEFYGKLLIPRVARVCKGDLGGQRTLQKKWTSFLKAKLVCSMPELNFVFNVVHDVFILKTPDRRETVIYGVFTSQWANVGLSAVCAYNMTSVEEVFSKGKYMQKATVEQSHTKWVRYNGITPTPRPGACINNQNRLRNITSSLHLPDKTLQFVKDHPLLEDPVLPIGNGPQLITKDVNYTQIVVERVQALNNNVYDIIFTGTDKGVLHKSVVYEGEVHTVEEIQLLQNSEPIQNLLLSSQGTGSIYAGSNSGIVQSPTAFCEKYTSCEDCILARDPYCAWNPDTTVCINIFHTSTKTHRNLIQSLNGDADKCPSALSLSVDEYQSVTVTLWSSVELPCTVRSNLAQILWMVNGSGLTEGSRGFHLLGDTGLLIHSVAPKDQGFYECWSLETAAGKNFTRLLAGYILSLGKAPSQSSHSTVPLSSRLSTLNHTEGPSDIHIHWQVNGQRLETTITEHRHPLSQREVLLSSWVREESLGKESHYRCEATAGDAGNDTSEIHLRLTNRDEDSTASKDMNQWMGALTEHEKLLKRWKKTWVGLRLLESYMLLTHVLIKMSSNSSHTLYRTAKNILFKLNCICISYDCRSCHQFMPALNLEWPEIEYCGLVWFKWRATERCKVYLYFSSSKTFTANYQLYCYFIVFGVHLKYSVLFQQ
ncbi:semaphorin-4D isoform X3 [Hypomesus transpacificus]|uniref:semaphorin-4D isoform X3 n=1 Tax=Hypomesus transpacificus TaxID=137520 RepID=UPI001F080581|nr:semaphorin-4D isoform X3 [Hypomesus transpacificus]